MQELFFICECSKRLQKHRSKAALQTSAASTYAANEAAYQRFNPTNLSECTSPLLSTLSSKRKKKLDVPSAVPVSEEKLSVFQVSGGFPYSEAAAAQEMNYQVVIWLIY